MTSTARTVTLEGVEVDTVWHDAADDDETVRRSLIDHDGYDARIVVTSRPVPLATFATLHGIGMQVDRVKRRPDRGPGQSEDERRWDAEASHYRVRLMRPGARPFGLYYSMGAAHKSPPTLPDVLDNLASDASGYDAARGFEDWASEYGYDTDSRKAERVYRAVEAQATKLRAFLGDDLYAVLLNGTERL